MSRAEPRAALLPRVAGGIICRMHIGPALERSRRPRIVAPRRAWPGALRSLPLLLLALACGAPAATRTVSAASVVAAAPDLPALPGTPGDPQSAITSGEIREHVEVLASDLFEGREAGTRGERRAAAYIVDRLEQSPALQPGGVDGGWLQPFPIRLHGADAVANNIIAMLPGTDPALAREVIVLGAHYDHVGFGESGNALDGPGEIHNGADDNASGSAVLLDLATSLADAGWQPRRTILFQWYSGEELGLLGSAYWCEQPLFPLADHVFMLNMDMVGRLVADTLLVGGTGTSPGLSELCREAGVREGLVLLDDPPGRAPSDNTSFYDKGIPVLFLFTGLHDDYHAATDDSARLNSDGAARIGRFAATLLLALDARATRPEFRPAPGDAHLFRPDAYIGAVFGVLPDGAPGPVQVAVVIPGSPAALAGLREQDIVLAVDGEALAPPVPGASGWQPGALAALEQRVRRLDEPLAPIRLRVLRRAGASTADDAPGGGLLDLLIQPVVR